MKNILMALCLICSSQLISQDMYETCPLKVGMEVPGDVEITNLQGKKETLNEVIGDTPTIIMFYRGGW